jgi:starch-binding outer membrane protein SusE/F
MKGFLNNIFLLSLLALALGSCKKDETIVVAKEGTVPSVTASSTTLVLDELDAAKDAVTFKWNASDFGYKAAVKYKLLFDKKGNNFASADSLDLGSSVESKLTVARLNTIANNIGLEGFKTADMEVRVKAEISQNFPAVFSTPLTITVTPYLSKPPYQTLYLVGDASDGGWDNAKASPVFRDPVDPFVFTYTGHFNKGYFKLLGALGKWTPMWGSNGSGGVSFRETDSDPDPASFEVVTEGYYKLTFSLRTNSISFTPHDASAAKTYNSIGIIGGFNGWGDITAMTKTVANPHIWSITHTFDSDTEMKFRIAEGWDVNWGAEADATVAEPYGKGKEGGPNLQVKAGTYKIIFNDLTAHYVLIKQ